MADSIVAVLNDPDTTEKVAAAAGRLALTLMLSRESLRLSEEIRQLSGTRLLILETGVGGEDGLERCRQLRAASDIPILIIGDKPDGQREAEALRAGADCYLPKSAEAELIQAHMEALLRRYRFGTTRQSGITVRDLTIDLIRKEVRLRGEPIAVTPGEYRLLTSLATQLGTVVPSSELLRAMNGYDCSEQEAQEIVKVHVSRLRSKIDRSPNEPSYILNVRGFGYMLERRSGPARE